MIFLKIYKVALISVICIQKGNDVALTKRKLRAFEKGVAGHFLICRRAQRGLQNNYLLPRVC
jgi:hypothetical protein